MSKKKKSPYHKANQTKRFIAYVIDWFLGSLMIMFPISMYYLAMTNDIESVSNANIAVIYQMFGKGSALAIGLIAAVLGILYYVVIPYILNGQTIGKKFLELKIVNTDESDVSFTTMFKRQFLILIIFETYIYSVSHLLIYMLELILNTEVVKYFYSFGMLVSIVSCLLVAFSRSHMAVHDIFAKTKVVGLKTANVDQKI